MHYLTSYNADDPTCERTDVTLSIYSIEPKRISEILGIKPTRSTTLGETIVNERTRRSRIGTVNSWHLCSAKEVRSKDARDHLDWLLAILEEVGAGLAELQNFPDVRMRVLCSWWAALGGGPTLWPKQMRALADLDLELSFSFADYSDDQEEENALPRLG